MLTLYFTKGLPGSGKSTWANQLIKESKGTIVGVNRDLLREMCWNNYFDSSNTENLVNEIRDYTINEAYKRRKSVVLHDTGFGDVYSYIQSTFGSKFDIKLVDFTDVPLETCILRDMLRPKPKQVGIKVILRMYNAYLKPAEQADLKSSAFQGLREIHLNLPDPNRKPCYVMDIDGTIAWMSSERSAFEWNKVGLDSLNPYMANIWKALQETKPNSDFIILSGRDGSCREETEKWLKTNQIYYHNLYMRPAGDQRVDWQVKKELYENHIKYAYQVMAVFDDRLQVCDFWHNEGLPLFKLGHPRMDF